MFIVGEKILGTDHYWRDWTVEVSRGVYQYVPINWSKAIARGVRWTCLKAADGIHESRFFKQAYDDARASGIGVFAYAWLYPNKYVSLREQAEYYYQVVKEINCPLALDCEAWLEYRPTADDVWGAAEEFWALDENRLLGVYTGEEYWREYGSTDPKFKKLFNWSARYNSIPPNPYAPWYGHKIWQFTGHGDAPGFGVSNGKMDVDLNYFCGSASEAQEFFGYAIDQITIPEPPQGEKMEITPTSLIGSKIRREPIVDGTNANQLAVLRYGEKMTVFSVIGSSGSEQWAEVEYNGQRAYVNVWYAGVQNAVLSGVLEPPAEPPATPTPLATFSVTDEDGNVYTATNVPLQKQP